MRRGSPDLRNFYPRPPRGGRRRQPVQWPRRFSISIHALREEGDLPLGRNETARKISIHALREEGDACTHPVFDVAIVFLSTPSARRATSGDNTQSLPICDFYPRPPRGGRPSAFPPGRPGCRISIHALREEGDGFLAKMQTSRPYFYPRPPRGGRRRGIFCLSDGAVISIHALREEGDDWCPRRKDDAEYFYPRPPRGGRLSDYTEMVADGDFYPRPPRGGRHLRKEPCRMTTSISIHALREEGDSDMDDTENT